jgi:hypothetical protein
MFILKGLAQNIIPLKEDEIERIHKERIEKIVKLGLRGITASKEEVIEELKITQDKEEKKQVIDTVLEEMTEFGDLE